MKYRKVRWEEHVTRVVRWEIYIFFGVLPWASLPLWRPRPSFDIIITRDLLGIEGEVLDWVDVAEDMVTLRAVSNKVLNLGIA